MKKVLGITVAIALVVLGFVIYKCNVYDTQFYSVFFNEGKIHTSSKLESVSYVSFLLQEVEGVYELSDKQDLVMWEEFVTWLNETTFTKVRSTKGSSYTGEGIYLKFTGVEEEFWLIVADDGKSIRFGDYVWKAEEDIVLPVDEEYLMEKKN